MTNVRDNWRARRAILILLGLIALFSGVALRVRYLQHEMLARGHASLEGGVATTQATIDEWFAERKADAEAFAATVSIHAAVVSGGDGSPPFTNVLAPVLRRGKFVAAWIVDSAGTAIAGSPGDSIREAERAALREAIAMRTTTHSEVMPLGPHGALLSLVAPVHLSGGIAAGVPVPAAVVMRTDAVKTFSPWAAGRPNAALSQFVTPAAGGAILIRACPEEQIPVCIARLPGLERGAPEALALATRDTFGVFRSHEGFDVLAVTRFDANLKWGLIRRVKYEDAVVPYHTELEVEGAFLAALLALAGMAAYAANRAIRVRRLSAKRRATERLSIVVDASTDGIISLDPEFAITMVNGAVERMLGFSRAALVGRPVFTLFAPEWHAPLAATLRDFAQSGAERAPLANTERCIALCADGQLMPVDARVGRAFVDGEPLYVLGLRDASERARTETFLHGQRHALEMIASGAPPAETLAALLAIVHAEAPMMRCAVHEVDDEQRVARLVAAGSLPAAITSAMHDGFAGPSSAAVGTAIHRGESVFSSDIATDPLWSESSAFLISHGIRAGWAMPLRAVDGHVIGALACNYDEPRGPTDRERELARMVVHLASIALSSARDAASLRASEASFRSFVENTPAAIFRETLCGDLVSANPAMVELLGYASVADLVQAAARNAIYHDDTARARLLHALETGDVARGVEMEWRRADQSLVTVRVSARAYRDDRGDVWLWEGYAENVTSLRAAEGALRRSERLAAVGQLISGVAHELNNPLSSIMHFAEDLLADQRSAADAEALGVIRDQARRSRAIVRDLLSFVRQRETNALPLSLDDIVAATVRAMEPTLAEAGVRLHLVNNVSEAIVLADRAGVEQIVANLVSNAVHAAGRGGDVWVSTHCRDSACDLVVEDSGPGIPSDVLPRIFDPFFTTKQTGEGTGLGLSVTLGIVEQLGGRITVTPRAGGPGSCFTVSLPTIGPVPATERLPEVGPEVSLPRLLSQVPEPGAEVPVPPAEADARVRLALIIDDEPTIRSALRRYFTRRGWAVEEAADGGAGLALLQDHGSRIGVVISDLRMPGFSGIELHDRLAVAEPALLRRFIFSTGDVASVEAASFVQRTACPVLQKPFELHMLDAIIAGVSRGEDAGRVVS